MILKNHVTILEIIDKEEDLEAATQEIIESIQEEGEFTHSFFLNVFSFLLFCMKVIDLSVSVLCTRYDKLRYITNSLLTGFDLLALGFYFCVFYVK